LIIARSWSLVHDWNLARMRQGIYIPGMKTCMKFVWACLHQRGPYVAKKHKTWQQTRSLSFHITNPWISDQYFIEQQFPATSITSNPEQNSHTNLISYRFMLGLDHFGFIVLSRCGFLPGISIQHPITQTLWSAS